MKFGDNVLAICKIGCQKTEQENEGILIKEIYGKFLCKFVCDQERILPFDKVKKYEKISFESLEQDCRDYFPKVVLSVENSCRALLSENDYGSIEVDEDDLTIQLLGGVVTVSPCAYRAKSIGVIREVAGFAVNEFVYHSGTYHEPEDIEERLYKVVRAGSVALTVVELLFRMKCSSYFESL